MARFTIKSPKVQSAKKVGLRQRCTRNSLTRWLIAPGSIPQPKTKPSGAINYDHKFRGGRKGGERQVHDIANIASVIYFLREKRNVCCRIGGFFLFSIEEKCSNKETRGRMPDIVRRIIIKTSENCVRFLLFRLTNILFILFNEHFIIEVYGMV